MGFAYAKSGYKKAKTVRGGASFDLIRETERFVAIADQRCKGCRAQGFQARNSGWADLKQSEIAAQFEKGEDARDTAEYR